MNEVSEKPKTTKIQTVSYSEWEEEQNKTNSKGKSSASVKEKADQVDQSLQNLNTFGNAAEMMSSMKNLSLRGINPKTSNDPVENYFNNMEARLAPISKIPTIDTAPKTRKAPINVEIGMGLISVAASPFKLINAGVAATCSTDLAQPVCTMVGDGVRTVIQTIPEPVRATTSKIIQQATVAGVTYLTDRNVSQKRAEECAHDLKTTLAWVVPMKVPSLLRRGTKTYEILPSVPKKAPALALERPVIDLMPNGSFRIQNVPPIKTVLPKPAQVSLAPTATPLALTSALSATVKEAATVATAVESLVAKYPPALIFSPQTATATSTALTTVEKITAPTQSRLTGGGIVDSLAVTQGAEESIALMVHKTVTQTGLPTFQQIIDTSKCHYAKELAEHFIGPPLLGESVETIIEVNYMVPPPVGIGPTSIHVNLTPEGFGIQLATLMAEAESQGASYLALRGYFTQSMEIINKYCASAKLFDDKFGCVIRYQLEELVPGVPVSSMKLTLKIKPKPLFPTIEPSASSINGGLRSVPKTENAVAQGTTNVNSIVKPTIQNIIENSEIKYIREMLQELLARSTNMQTKRAGLLATEIQSVTQAEYIALVKTEGALTLEPKLNIPLENFGVYVSDQIKAVQNHIVEESRMLIRGFFKITLEEFNTLERAVRIFDSAAEIKCIPKCELVSGTEGICFSFVISLRPINNPPMARAATAPQSGGLTVVPKQTFTSLPISIGPAPINLIVGVEDTMAQQAINVPTLDEIIKSAREEVGQGYAERLTALYTNNTPNGPALDQLLSTTVQTVTFAQLRLPNTIKTKSYINSNASNFAQIVIDERGNAVEVGAKHFFFESMTTGSFKQLLDLDTIIRAFDPTADLALDLHNKLMTGIPAVKAEWSIAVGPLPSKHKLNSLLNPDRKPHIHLAPATVTAAAAASTTTTLPTLEDILALSKEKEIAKLAETIQKSVGDTQVTGSEFYKTPVSSIAEVLMYSVIEETEEVISGAVNLNKETMKKILTDFDAKTVHFKDRHITIDGYFANPVEMITIFQDVAPKDKIVTVYIDGITEIVGGVPLKKMGFSITY